MGGEGGVNRQHPRKSYERGNGHEIAQGLVRELRVKPRIDNERGVRRGRNGVAIRIGLHQRLQANGSVRAGAVLDKYLLPQSLRELLCREPADEVGPSAGGVWNDHPDRLLRPGLRARNRGRDQENGSCHRDSAWNLSHRLPSPYIVVALRNGLGLILSLRRRWHPPSASCWPLPRGRASDACPRQSRAPPLL